MDITPLIPEGRKRVLSYGTGVFHISGVRYAGSVILLPEAVHPWRPRTIEEVTADDVRDARRHIPAIDVLLLGSGRSFASLPEEADAAFADLGLVPEVMDTGAACRTYNVLLGEGRQTAALLLAC
jgi:uncharacterized protein